MEIHRVIVGIVTDQGGAGREGDQLPSVAAKGTESVLRWTGGLGMGHARDDEPVSRRATAL